MHTTTTIPLRPCLATRALRAMLHAFEALQRAHRRWQRRDRRAALFAPPMR